MNNNSYMACFEKHIFLISCHQYQLTKSSDEASVLLVKGSRVTNMLILRRESCDVFGDVFTSEQVRSQCNREIGEFWW